MAENCKMQDEQTLENDKNELELMIQNMDVAAYFETGSAESISEPDNMSVSSGSNSPLASTKSDSSGDSSDEESSEDSSDSSVDLSEDLTSPSVIKDSVSASFGGSSSDSYVKAACSSDLEIPELNQPPPAVNLETEVVIPPPEPFADLPSPGLFTTTPSVSSKNNLGLPLEPDIVVSDDASDYSSVSVPKHESCTVDNRDNECYIVESYKSKVGKAGKSGSPNSFVEVIDLTEDDPEEEKLQNSLVDEFTKDTRLCILLDVLPDADTDFLKKKVSELKTDYELQLFVMSALETENYPKINRVKKIDTKKNEENAESDRLNESVKISSSYSLSASGPQPNASNIPELSEDVFPDLLAALAFTDELPVNHPPFPPPSKPFADYTFVEATEAAVNKPKPVSVPHNLPYSPPFAHSTVNVPQVGQQAIDIDKPHTITSQALTFRHPSGKQRTFTASVSLSERNYPLPVCKTVNTVNVNTTQGNNEATHTSTYIPFQNNVTSSHTGNEGRDRDALGPDFVLPLTIPDPPTNEQLMPRFNGVARATWVPPVGPAANNFPDRNLMFRDAQVWVPYEMPWQLHRRHRQLLRGRRRHRHGGIRPRMDVLGMLGVTEQLDEFLMQDIYDVLGVPRSEDAVTAAPVAETVEDQRYNLIAEILFSANPEYLKREVSKLKNDDDVNKFLINAIVNEEMWSKNVTDNGSPALVAGAQGMFPGLTDNKYKILSELLPDASPTFLKRESIKLKSDEDVHEFALKLSREQSYPKRKSSATSSQSKSAKRKLTEISEPEPIDPKYQTLLDMLPDADPDFLLEQSKMLLTQDDLQAFVLKAVEENTYPKRQQFLERQEYHKQWKKYIENFDIKEFLRLIPNPVRYFYIEKKNSKNPLDMPLKFLQHRYRRKTIDFSQYFRLKKQNLTKTCDHLDVHFRMKPRKLGPWDQKTILSTPVLQEIAFIQNKKEIAHYLLFKDKRKSEAYEKAKNEGTLQECSCCYEEKLPEDMACCCAGHLFCLNCIKRGSEVVIGDGRTSFPCYHDGCTEEFSLEVLKNVLSTEAFSRVLTRKQYEEVNAAGIPGLETCSFCEFCSIPPAEDKLFYCLNPSCLKVTCRSCKKLDHLPLSCEEFAKKDTEQKMQSYVEDKMTEALVRTCWQCGTKFVKENGCNMMQCKCGAKMCYFCREPVKDYSHFASGRCNEYLDTSARDEAVVMNVGKKAKQEMESANPGFKLVNDPTQNLMPLNLSNKKRYHRNH